MGPVKQEDADRIAKVVAKRLGRDFANIEILRVDVTQDSDRDGDEILRIEVVFEGDLKGPDVASAARRLRPALEEIDADMFPLLSFVSKVDYDRGRKRGEAH